MMMEQMFKVSNEEELKNVNCQYHTHEVSANNGQSQLRLAYNDFLYDAKKGKQKHNVKYIPHNFPKMNVMKQRMAYETLFNAQFKE